MDNSRLGLLPAELRNMIYEYTLTKEDALEIRREHALLLTCKQIRAEAELMFYAINEFFAYVHEQEICPGIFGWLKGKAGPRVNSIRRLELRVEMPSITRRTASSRHFDDETVANDDGDDFFEGFLLMMDIMAVLRKTKFDRCYKCVVHFTVNGAPDSESFEKIEAMTLLEQDRYQGAKFLLMSLMHGERRTVDAMLDEVDGPYELYAMYHAIERHRDGGPWLVNAMAPH